MSKDCSAHVLECGRCYTTRSRKWWRKIGEPEKVLCARCRWRMDRVRIGANRRWKLQAEGKRVVPQKYEPMEEASRPKEQLTVRLSAEVMDRVRLMMGREGVGMMEALERGLRAGLGEDGEVKGL